MLLFAALLSVAAAFSSRDAAAPAPTIGLAAGTYTGAQSVPIAIPSGTQVYCSTKGEPDASLTSHVTSAVSVRSSCTLRCRAYRTGHRPSAIVSASYTIREKRPATNPGVGFFVKHGKIYDANGVEFLARGINRAHVPDYGVGWPAMERARFNAVRQGAFFFYRRGCAGIERPSSWPTDLMQEAILHEQVVVPATFYLRCWYAGAPVTLGPKEGPNADGTWPEMEAALDLIIARAAALKRMERHVWIDPVNEWGNSITRDRSWIDGYSHAIMRLRGTHPRCVSTPSYCMSPPWGGPIVVGLNGGGQSLSNLFANDPRTGTNLMQQLWNADPHKNLIVSIHVYGLWCDSAANAPCNPIEWQWKSYDIGRHFDEIRAHADRIGYGVVIGEFGPGGGMQLDDVTDVTAIRVMQRAQEVGFGWFAWAWDDDHACGGSPPFCGEGYPPRPCFLIPKYCGNGGTALYRTTADLTPFGVTIIEHPRYGSRATSMKATTFP